MVFVLVLPEEYAEHLSIDTSTGVLSVRTAFNREEMNSNNVLVGIKVLTLTEKLV